MSRSSDIFNPVPVIYLIPFSSNDNGDMLLHMVIAANKLFQTTGKLSTSPVKKEEKKSCKCPPQHTGTS